MIYDKIEDRNWINVDYNNKNKDTYGMFSNLLIQYTKSVSLRSLRGTHQN